jgi:hypothetical protein
MKGAEEEKLVRPDSISPFIGDCDEKGYHA